MLIAMKNAVWRTGFETRRPCWPPRSALSVKLGAAEVSCLLDAIGNQLVNFGRFVKHVVSAQRSRPFPDFGRGVVGQNDNFLMLGTVATAGQNAQPVAARSVALPVLPSM